MRDRFVPACLAGIIGDLMKDGLNLLSHHALGLAKLRYLDYTGFMIYGRLPKGIWENAFAALVEAGFSAILGVGFAYLLDVIGTRHLYLKSVAYTVGFWFFAFSVFKLFRIEPFVLVDLGTAVSNLATSSIDGFIVAFVLDKMHIERMVHHRVR